MNSRGALITHRISGETLASNDRVAMTPTVQPAAAGIQRYREFDRPPERDAERGLASVTDREDIPSTREMPDEARESPRQIVRAPSRPSPAGQRPARGRLGTGSAGRWLGTAKLAPRPSRRKPGTVKWSPTPTASHEIISRRSGPVRGTFGC